MLIDQKYPLPQLFYRKFRVKEKTLVNTQKRR